MLVQSHHTCDVGQWGCVHQRFVLTCDACKNHLSRLTVIRTEVDANDFRDQEMENDIVDNNI